MYCMTVDYRDTLRPSRDRSRQKQKKKWMNDNDDDIVVYMLGICYCDDFGPFM